MKRETTIYILAALFLLGTALRIYGIGFQSVWIDEADIYARANLPTFLDVVSARFGIDPPLHPVLLRLWMHLGHSDAMARGLSALFGVATLLACFGLLRDLFDDHVALIGTGLLAINPFHIWYSQEIRVYVMFALLATLATWLLWRALEKPSWGRWSAYGALMVACGWSHAIAFFLAVSHAGFALFELRDRPRMLVRFGVTWAWVALLLEPLVVGRVLGMSTGAAHQIDKPTSIFNLAYMFFAQSVGTSLGPSIYELQAQTSLSAVLPYAKTVIAAGVAFAVPLLVGVVGGLRSGVARERRAVMLLLVVMVVTPMGLFIVDALGSSTMNPRHTIGVLVPYLGLVALGIVRLGRRWGALALAAIVVLSAMSLSNHYWNESYAKEDARGAAAYLDTIDGNDAVAVVLSYPYGIAHYYHGPMPLIGPSDLVELHGAALRADLRRLADHHHELVYVDLRAWHTDPEAHVRAACDALFSPVETRVFHGVTVVRYHVGSD